MSELPDIGRARRLRSRGFTRAEIAALLDAELDAVHDALDPEYLRRRRPSHEAFMLLAVSVSTLSTLTLLGLALAVYEISGLGVPVAALLGAGSVSGLTTFALSRHLGGGR